jgi:hypothetical protein
MRALAFTLTLGCACLAVTGCGSAGTTLEEIRPVQATLVDLTLLEGALLGGLGVGGGAVLMTGADGKRWRVPVRITTATVGTMMNLCAQRGGDFTFEFGGADIETARDVFGGYDGVRWGVFVIGGYGGFGFENEHHVVLTGGSLGVGIGFYVGHEWLSLEPTDDPQEITIAPPADAGVVDAGA